MQTLIVYMSSRGCAGKAALMIRDLLPDEVTVINLESDELPFLDSFHTLIIGGSIRIGNLQKRLKKFCEKNLDQLLKKRIGLYICCMYEGNKAREQLMENYPEPLVSHAVGIGIFGGELDFDKMNVFERMIIKDVIGITVNVSLFNEKAVRAFVKKITG
ncbi:MAG: flavodoxin [Bacteroidales bacterium]|nr:flavodoxin [Bacteroidota bacterium]MBL6950706.1 flavodoxin [Bacteroidales bacterium]